MRRGWGLLLCLLGLIAVPGALAQQEGEVQTSPRQVRHFPVERAVSEIKVDGALDEPAWSEATVIPLDLEWFPGDNVEPPVKTEGLVTYDDRHIYIGFRCYDPQPRQIRAHLMDRDEIVTLVQDDHISVMLDTFNDERRALQFRVNPLGVQADAIFSEVDGIEDFSWDMIWSSGGRITADGYEVEIAFPVNQLRFPKGQGPQTWGIELGRSYPRSSRHRINDSGQDRDVSCILCQFNKITGLEGLEPGRNLELDPTVTASRTDELDEFPDGDLETADEEADVGLTVRWGVTPNLTLTGTINPDFSQVEADVAQLNVNERFVLFFEEKRPFFLEGIDFFSTPFNAVHTRTIIDPDWGLKLTGKQNRNAIGVFAAEDSVTGLLVPSNQESSTVLLEEPVTNGVFRYRRDVGANSTLGVLYTGREGDAYHNRVGGFDGFLRLGDKDTIEFQYLYSSTLYPESVAVDLGQPIDAFTDDAFQMKYVHDARNWYWELYYDDRGPEFRLDSGFLPRVDTKEAEGLLLRSFWGEDEDWYDRWRLGSRYERTEDHEGQLTDEEIEVFVDFNGPLQSFVQLELERNERLFDGVLYEDLDSWGLFAELQPSGAVKLEMYVEDGETVDVSNGQRADELLFNPIVEAKLGRRINIKFDHFLQRLDVEGGELFEANLSQLRLVYNFSVRMFVRGIFQYLDVRRDPELYTSPVEPETETLFTQLLFSYKLNARTVLFAGYSDNHLGNEQADLTRTDRTFFFKIGYAWVL